MSRETVLPQVSTIAATFATTTLFKDACLASVMLEPAMRLARTILLLALSAMILGCCDGPVETDAANGTPRVASLSPALTMTMNEVGLGDLMVGRSAFCRGVDHLPVVGDLHNFHAEHLVRLQPTHVLVQRARSDVDPALLQLASLYGWHVVAQPIVGLEDVATFLTTLPEVFPDIGVSDTCESLGRQIDDVLTAVPKKAAPTVLIVSDGPSPLAWGGQSYLGDLLRAAGGRPMLPETGWASLSLEDIARLDPDLVLIPIRSDAIQLAELGGVVDASKTRLLYEEAIDLPGPHLLATIPKIRQLINPAAAYTESP